MVSPWLYQSRAGAKRIIDGAPEILDIIYKSQTQRLMPQSAFHIHCTKMIFGFSEVLSDDGSPTATVPMVPKRRRVTERYRPLNSDEQVGDIFFFFILW